jgi:hypothetical protein
VSSGGHCPTGRKVGANSPLWPRDWRVRRFGSQRREGARVRSERRLERNLKPFQNGGNLNAAVG